MGLKTHITDSATKLTAEVIKNEACGCQALAVAVVPYREFKNASQFFTNAIAGVDMNVNAGFSGMPLYVYNADTASLWAATDIVGGRKTDFVNANLAKSDFRDSDLQASKFQNTNLENANLVGAKNYYIDPTQNKLKKAKFSSPGVLSLLAGFEIEIE